MNNEDILIVNDENGDLSEIMNLEPTSIPLEEKTMVSRIQFKRHINSAKVEVTPDDNAMGVFEVEGSAFLYYQVRCMMSMLVHIGAGLEEESLISDMLDLNVVRSGWRLSTMLCLILWLQ